jgi:hypothetical protein
MGRILALMLFIHFGPGAPQAVPVEPKPDLGADPPFSSPQRITAPKRYLSTNSFCRSVSNGCVLCYRDEDTIHCTEAQATCTPRSEFRCNRF